MSVSPYLQRDGTILPPASQATTHSSRQKINPANILAADFSKLDFNAALTATTNPYGEQELYATVTPTSKGDMTSAALLPTRLAPSTVQQHTAASGPISPAWVNAKPFTPTQSPTPHPQSYDLMSGQSMAEAAPRQALPHEARQQVMYPLQQQRRDTMSTSAAFPLRAQTQQLTSYSQQTTIHESNMINADASSSGVSAGSSMYASPLLPSSSVVHSDNVESNTVIGGYPTALMTPRSASGMYDCVQS